MTEPAPRSMAASLANIEERRSSLSQPIQPSPMPPFGSTRSTLRAGSARSYLDQAQGELSKLRADILEAELEWKRNRSELQSKFDDNIAKLNGEYAAILTNLTDMARRIEATRE